MRHPLAVAFLSLAVAAVLPAQDGPPMVYGPCLMTTFEGGGLCGTTTKGLVIRLGELGAIAFDTELLRPAAAWTDGWLQLRGTAYDGSHGPMPSLQGRKLFETRETPGFASPDGFADPRPIPHGPLPRELGRYRGMWLHGDSAAVGYTIGTSEVRETYSLLPGPGRVLLRTIEFAPCQHEHTLVVGDVADGATDASASAGNERVKVLHAKSAEAGKRLGLHLAAALRGDSQAALVVDGSRLLLRVPAHDQTIRLQLAIAGGDEAELNAALPKLPHAGPIAALPTKPAPARFAHVIVTKGECGADDEAFAVDTITIPFDNPFHSRMRTAAFDFFADGRAAVSTWNGDVWIVSGIDDDLDRLEWRRFANGLFDPLGLRIVDGVVHVHGRDGLTRLHDENGDGEADFYECFTNQVYATPAFHEFAFDLQTDRAGDFYISKGAPVNPGGRGFMKIVPHHGTILKISKDGSTTTTLATGLRAPNGIGISADGVVTSGDNEGTFMPRCRLNWITKPGYYAGVRPTAQRSDVPEQPDLPLCWFPMEVDNSGGGQTWVDGSGWKDLNGRLLHLSYGTCSVYLVLQDEVDGVMQGGVVRLPANFSSSCMRGRFSAIDGQLYVVGLQGWQTSAARDGGFHRVRRTKAPLGLPTTMRTCDRGIYLTFAEPLDAATANDPESFGVTIWNYLYSPNYGSPEVSVLQPERQVEKGKENRDPLTVTSARLSPDARTVFLAIDGMRPVHQMRITWDLDAADGRALKGEIHNTIHRLAKDPGFPGEGAR